MLNPGPTSALSFNNLLGADFSRGPVRLIPEQSDGVIESYMLSSGPFLRYSSTWYIPSPLSMDFWYSPMEGGGRSSFQAPSVGV